MGREYPPSPDVLNLHHLDNPRKKKPQRGRAHFNHMPILRRRSFPFVASQILDKCGAGQMGPGRGPSYYSQLSGSSYQHTALALEHEQRRPQTTRLFRSWEHHRSQLCAISCICSRFHRHFAVFPRRGIAACGTTQLDTARSGRRNLILCLSPNTTQPSILLFSAPPRRHFLRCLTDCASHCAAEYRPVQYSTGPWPPDIGGFDARRAPAFVHEARLARHAWTRKTPTPSSTVSAPQM